MEVLSAVVRFSTNVSEIFQVEAIDVVYYDNTMNWSRPKTVDIAAASPGWWLQSAHSWGIVSAGSPSTLLYRNICAPPKRLLTWGRILGSGGL
jgi:hypothetical protein